MTLRRKVTLGPSGNSVSVSPLCVGIVTDPDTVIAAWDLGVNFFFVTADMHWPLYAGLREGLVRLAKARPQAVDEAVIACCSYVAQPEFLAVPFLEALAELKPFRRFEVLVAGGAYDADVDRRLEVLKDNIRHERAPGRLVGTSVHDRPAGARVVNAGSADLVFVRYNSRHPGAQFDFFPRLVAGRTTRVFNFKSTFGYHPEADYLAAGVEADVWFPSVTDHYRFVLCRPEVDGLLCAPRTPREIEGIVEAYGQGPLQPDEEAHLLALSSALLDHAKAQARVRDGPGPA